MLPRWCRSLVAAVATGAALASAAAPAHGYAVGPAVALEELARSSDLVLKATVVAVRPAVDPWFEPLPGYEVRETELRVVSVVRGTATARRLRFRHYGRKAGMGAMYAPQSYELAIGRTYLVFADGAGGDVIRQIAKRHTIKPDQGVMLAADDRPHRGATVTDVVWAELRGLLASAADADVVEAIGQLDELSGGRTSRLKDLDRSAALAAIRPMVLHRSPAVATAAIDVFGADSPYFDDSQAAYWLAGVGKGTISGLSPRRPTPNPTAAVAVRELLDVADARTSPGLRALAVRALGRSQVVPAARLAVLARDPEVVVRRAAVLVSAELADRTLIRAGAIDASPDVRSAAALAVGFTQDPALLPLLDRAMDDGDAKVRRAAAMSLLSFAPAEARATLTRKLGSDFRSLFINALAREDAQAHLPLLAEVIEKQLQPNDWWGGRIPAADSWDILYAHVKGRPAGELTAGKLDRSLDALERMRWWSSSEPRRLYALYLLRGMPARAKALREATKTTFSSSVDPLFDMADADPSGYVD